MSGFDDLAAMMLANPMDRGPQLIFADWLDEHGSPDFAAVIRTQGIVKRFIDGGGYGGGYGDDYGYGDGGGGGYGDGYGGGGGYGDGGGGDGINTKTIPDGLTMKNGLHIVTIPAGYSPYVLVGWAERNDLFISLKNCRVIRRFGSLGELAKIAKKGPQTDTQLLEASKEELIPVTSIGRAIPCDEKAWRKECPKPD